VEHAVVILLRNAIIAPLDEDDESPFVGRLKVEDP
jgi:hypothetical protein